MNQTMLSLRPLLLLIFVASSTPLTAQEALPVHVAGRAVRDSDGGWHFGWPGVYFESRFRGTAVTVAVESTTETLRLSLDGAEERVLVRPGTARFTLSGLPEGEHVVRLDKMTESQTGSVRFLGFFAEPGIVPLDPPARTRRIEYIGDSLTVGYGNSAPGRTCTREEVHDTTDTTRAFGRSSPVAWTPITGSMPFRASASSATMPAAFPSSTFPPSIRGRSEKVRFSLGAMVTPTRTTPRVTCPSGGSWPRRLPRW